MTSLNIYIEEEHNASTKYLRVKSEHDFGKNTLVKNINHNMNIYYLVCNAHHNYRARPVTYHVKKKFVFLQSPWNHFLVYFPHFISWWIGALWNNDTWISIVSGCQVIIVVSFLYRHVKYTFSSRNIFSISLIISGLYRLSHYGMVITWERELNSSEHRGMAEQQLLLNSCGWACGV